MIHDNMEKEMYIVQYSGPFAFIKPWTAVRDSLTFSQQFLTPSILMGIELKLFPELLGQKEYKKKIIRHKLTYAGMSRQQEQTQTRGIKVQQRLNRAMRPRSILARGVLISPVLYLAFADKADAEIAVEQHVCLCRNEDLLLPSANIMQMQKEEFDSLDGFELHFEETDNSFMVGYNRFKNGEIMFGWLDISENPLQRGSDE